MPARVCERNKSLLNRAPIRMQQQHSTIIPVLVAILSALLALPAAAGKLPSFEQVVQSNDVRTLTAWGRRYARGVGVPQDPAKAIKLFCKSARKGHVDAKFQLGQIYAFGHGVERDWDLAAAWFYEAAEAGNHKAESMLRILKVKSRPKRKASCSLGTTSRIGRAPAASIERHETERDAELTDMKNQIRDQKRRLEQHEREITELKERDRTQDSILSEEDYILVSPVPGAHSTDEAAEH